MSKRQLLAWHRRVGLACALFLALQGLTGAALALRDPLERLIAPELRLPPSAHPALSLERQVALARAARPQAVLLRATYPGDCRAAPRFLFDAGGNFYMLALDPRSGAVLRKGGLGHWPIEAVLRLHANLMGGSTGQALVGLDGAALAVLVVLGWRLWWPGRKRLKNGLKVIRGAGAERFVRSLHRAVGGAGALFLLCAALTGTALCWLPHASPALDSAQASPPARTLDQALAAWTSHHYQARIARLTFEPASVTPIRIDWAVPGSPLPLQTNVFEGPMGLSLAPTVRSLDMVETQQILLGLHSGRIIGPLGTLLALLAACLLAALSLTGLWAWWRVTRQRNKGKRPVVSGSRSSCEVR